MRTHDEVEDFKVRTKKDGDTFTRAKHVSLYRACVPRDFWDVRPDDVAHNVEAFRSYVVPYCTRLDRARASGYGLFFEGDNGVGKTMFLSYVLGYAVERGYLAYYTTVLDLDFDLKRGFGDREIMGRMDQLLDSDFLALDELSKEQFRSGDSWIRTQVERVLKRRHDNNMPTLVASNASAKKVGQAYGATVASVLAGKYQHVVFDAGDYRDRLRSRMREDMGYE